MPLQSEESDQKQEKYQDSVGIIKNYVLNFLNDLKPPLTFLYYVT